MSAEICPGEIMFASSYGGMEDYVFTSTVAVTPAWLDVVRERKAVLCEANNTFWMDFQLNTALVLDGEEDEYEVDPYLLFARRYCYKRFCETFAAYFGMTELFGFLYRAFSHRHKEPRDEYDAAYANFVDTVLRDVRFVVCVKRRRATPADVPFEPDTARTGGRGSTPQTDARSADDFEADFMELEAETPYPAGRGFVTVPETRSARTPTTSVSLPVTTHASAYTLAYLDGRGGGGDDDDDGTSEPTAHGPRRPPANVCAHKGKRPSPPDDDYFAGSPTAAEVAPDVGGGDEMEASFTARAAEPYDHTAVEASRSGRTTGLGGGDDLYDRLPRAILYDPVADTGRPLDYESEAGAVGSERFAPGAEGVFELVGLFDRPAPVVSTRQGSTIELKYAVRPLDNRLTFTVIDVTNGYLTTRGDRGRVRLETDRLTNAMREYDPDARLLDPARFDMYSFDLDLSGLHAKSRLRGKRILYLRFAKTG